MGGGVPFTAVCFLFRCLQTIVGWRKSNLQSSPSHPAVAASGHGHRRDPTRTGGGHRGRVNWRVGIICFGVFIPVWREETAQMLN